MGLGTPRKLDAGLSVLLSGAISYSTFTNTEFDFVFSLATAIMCFVYHR